MMKLYYSSGSCSMSCHIALEEAGLPHSAIQVDWDKPDANLETALKLNPLAVMPVLVNDQNKVLTQNIAILEYVADLKPESKLLPAAGTWERVETMSWLSFVAADLHKAFSPVFMHKGIGSNDTTHNEVRDWGVKSIQDYVAHLDKHLAGRDYLMGNQFTVADAYCFTVLGWGKWVNVSLDAYKNVGAYMARVYQRPAVQKVLKIEGLLS